jgi:ferric-dicitrate binding protein FerR (iron transport regulator)
MLITIWSSTLNSHKYLISTTDQNPVPETLCTVSAPKGHIAKCVLPDGTGVWINTNSSITYDIASYNGACRDIRLLGEAYFEVSQNKGKPFVVKTPLANSKWRTKASGDTGSGGCSATTTT